MRTCERSVKEATPPAIAARGWRAPGWGLALALLLTACRTPSTAPAATEIRGAPDAEVDRRSAGYAHYAAGVVAELNERPAEAREHFRQAALADPTEETLVLRVAGELLQAKEPEEAVRLLEQCIRAVREPSLYYVWLGIAQMQRGDLEASQIANREALARNPVLMLAYQNLVAIHAERKEPESVLRVIREAAAQTTGDPAFYVEVAELFFGFGRMHPERAEAMKEPALAALDRAAALGVTDPFVAERLAGGFKRLGELQKAEAVYRGVLARAPGAPMVRESLVDLYLLSNNRQAASELLRELVRDQPRNGRAAYVLGSIALQENRLDEAERHLRTALIQEPGLENAYYELAVVLLTRGDAQAALDILQQAQTRLRLRSHRLEFYLGLAQMRAERYDEAVRHFAEAEVVAGTNAAEALNHVFYFQYGAACERRGDRVAAERHFRKCLELSPNFAEALNYLGYMWAERGENLEEARQLIERALALEPDNAAFLDSMGWVLFQQGKPADALGWIRKAIEKSEEPDATLYDHLGDIYQALGQGDEARRAWQRSLELTDSEAVRRKLQTGSHAPRGDPKP